jgi:hypothetical protein
MADGTEMMPTILLHATMPLRSLGGAHHPSVILQPTAGAFRRAGQCSVGAVGPSDDAGMRANRVGIWVIASKRQLSNVAACLCDPFSVLSSYLVLSVRMHLQLSFGNKNDHTTIVKLDYSLFEVQLWKLFKEEFRRG